MLEAGTKPFVDVAYQLSSDSDINEYSAHPVVPVPDWKTRFYASEC